MLTPEETKNLIEMEKEKHFMIVDDDAREKHRQFILGMECVYDE